MKISLIYPSRPGKMVGNIDRHSVQAHVTDLASALTGMGHDVTVNTIDDDPIHGVGRIAHELDLRWSLDKPDLVHAHLWTAGLAALATVHQSGIVHDMPIMQTFHALNSMRLSSAARIRMWQRLEAAVARSVDHIVASCQRERTELISIGADSTKITVIPHGVNTEMFSPTGPEVVPAGGRRLVAVGPISPESGFTTAISALTYLPDAELVIAAGAPSGAGDSWSLANDHEAKRLSTVAHKLQVDKRVNLIELRRDELPRLFRSAEIVVCMPWHDMPGTTAIEAMASGRPVVVAGVGELLDVVIEGTTGVFVPPQDPVALAHALRDLLDDPIRLEGFGLAALERVDVRHTWKVVAQQLSDLYDHALTPQ